MIGSGAGASTAAHILKDSSFDVLVCEMGPYRTKQNFDMNESSAYQNLYQESGARLTEDGGISIFQGKVTGGSTSVNWASSFRTPESTLDVWKKLYGLSSKFSEEIATLYLPNEEKKHSVSPWHIPPNANNQKLLEGAKRLEYKAEIIPRNVKGCMNLGYCGLGCPIGAKQDAAVTKLSPALKAGVKLVTQLKVEKLLHGKGRVHGAEARPVDVHGNPLGSVKITIKAKYIFLAAGAIGSSALALRSSLEDPFEMVGKRTFLHPTVGMAADWEEDIHPYYGAPQSVYSDHFLSGDPTTSDIGFKLETAPLHPVLASQVVQGMGHLHAERMQKLKSTSNLIALLRDGFHRESQGGEVFLKDDGSEGIHYELTPYLWDGVKRAYKAMGETLLAAGAKSVLPIHTEATSVKTSSSLTSTLDRLSYKTLKARIFSAHVMGGMPFGSSEKDSICTHEGRHHFYENLYVADGSIFPTSVGTNPQMTIYAFAAKLASTFLRDKR